MVKADVRRDYYADLGLTPSAETEDIKKQFRKLALKYHPDRNPGKEVEFISKFQAIQAANEILSDPQQRLRYDTDRLRAGYGKLYGPAKTSTPRKAPMNPYASYSPKPQPAKPNFSTRPQSFHNGPSTGAQRYASYARAAPKQPWEKMHDDGQTRADAYRGFHDMKGSGMPGGWSSFDPRTGYSGAGARPHATANGQTPRPKSAYEYFRKSPKGTTSPDPTRSQSAKKKSGFAPRAAAGGDEPMAANTSAYTSVPRAERSQTPNSFFGAAPSPTAKKAAAFGHRRADTPDYERSSSRYANTGGERTFFSSAGLGRSASTRDSTESPKPRSRTNPPSPSPPETGRHRSASPKLKKDKNRNYSSTSSSDLDEEDFMARKPKAVPKSRLQPHRKFNDFHTERNGNKSPETGPGSDNAESAKDPFDTSAFFGDGSPLKSPKKSEFSTPHRNFKSSSHEQLRQPFTATSWSDTDFFGFAQSDKELKKHGRGRPSRKPATADRFQTTLADTTDPQPADSESASSGQPAPFAQAKFSADAWSEQFQNMSWAMPTSDGSQPKQANTSSQRQRSPRKQTRSGTTVRPTPRAASVVSEAEEAQTTVDGSDSLKAEGIDVEAMDLDDMTPVKDTGKTTKPEKAAKDDRKEMPPPKSRLSSSKAAEGENEKLFDLRNLAGTAPFTQTNSGGIDDLEDIHVSLPFESRAKVPQTTMDDIRPRKIKYPNPPKPPIAPKLVPISPGSKELGLPIAAWNRFTAEMAPYTLEWKAYNKRMLGYVLDNQEMMDTRMAPNWITAIGDSTRLKVDPEDDQGDDESNAPGGGASFDSMMAGGGNAGFNDYFRGIDETRNALTHLEVAREIHRKCMRDLGDLRCWIRNGGKLT
ncbi:hypothetical protein BO71DRAFT_448451 [Aspergillus ellipticus CBS 707.79]|uniref:J domain-containing protein n=1 Tax=Aspergillus ellipticus CBS 707.79 TaxID=1448320 RepID=A0A319DZ59_9EURO|nr:hypothetical protein BO71DRAFT_448451 [Aspergillus ellipticus CBS 707.79]